MSATCYDNDAQMIAALLSNDEEAVRYVFYDHYDLLLRRNAHKVCSRHIDFNDLRQELYLYLYADNWRRMRRYDPRLPFENWLSVVSYRFFKDYAKSHYPTMTTTDAVQQETSALSSDYEPSTIAGIDLRNALLHIASSRDREILQALLINDEDPSAVAARHNITVDNLYNIKRRALARLIRQSLCDYSAR